MKREPIEYPEGMQICCSKMCKDTATVIINPENKQVIEVVAEHFNQKIPMVIGPSSRRQFDVVLINGQPL